MQDITYHGHCDHCDHVEGEQMDAEVDVRAERDNGVCEEWELMAGEM